MKSQDQGVMTHFEKESHSFLLRLWLEHRDALNDPTDAPEWRGWIEHIQSKQRHYFRETSQLTHIIEAYLMEGDIADDVFDPIHPTPREIDDHHEQ